MSLCKYFFYHYFLFTFLFFFYSRGTYSLEMLTMVLLQGPLTPLPLPWRQVTPRLQLVFQYQRLRWCRTLVPRLWTGRSSRTTCPFRLSLGRIRWVGSSMERTSRRIHWGVNETTCCNYLSLWLLTGFCRPWCLRLAPIYSVYNMCLLSMFSPIHLMRVLLKSF